MTYPFVHNKDIKYFSSDPELDHFLEPEYWKKSQVYTIHIKKM